MKKIKSKTQKVQSKQVKLASSMEEDKLKKEIILKVEDLEASLKDLALYMEDDTMDRINKDGKELSLLLKKLYKKGNN